MSNRKLTALPRMALDINAIANRAEGMGLYTIESDITVKENTERKVPLVYIVEKGNTLLMTGTKGYLKIPNKHLVRIAEELMYIAENREALEKGLCLITEE